MTTQVINKYHLKTGLAIAILLPGIFFFERVGENAAGAFLLFLTIFFFIIILWAFNARFIEFGEILRNFNLKKNRKVYSNILVSLILSIPLYVTLAVLFGQDQLLFLKLYKNDFSVKSIFYQFLRIILFDVGLLIIKFILDNNKEQQKYKLQIEILKNEQLEATLESFKQQVDPHFLFNALNTVQSLVKQQKIDATLQFIKELSAVYRYMLTRREKNYLTVEEELEFLKSYLYLLEIRFGEAFKAEIDVDTDDMNCLIPVHTLQLLAENVVKHNVVDDIIPLRLRIASHGDYLLVSNNIRHKKVTISGSQIGLQNINSRYQLLFSKEIIIDDSNGYFNILLPLIKANENINNRR